MNLLELTYRRIKSLDLHVSTSPLATTQSNWFAGCCLKASTTHCDTAPGSKSRWLTQLRHNKFLIHDVLVDLTCHQTCNTKDFFIRSSASLEIRRILWNPKLRGFRLWQLCTWGWRTSGTWFRFTGRSQHEPLNVAASSSRGMEISN
jgi:hypothetical protein